MHSGLLSWSAIATGQAVDLRGLVEPSVDIGLRGGSALIRLGRSVRRQPTFEAVEGVAAELGPEAAVSAAAVAAGFELVNRVVDATGLHLGRHAREQNDELIRTLGADAFPHASH